MIKEVLKAYNLHIGDFEVIPFGGGLINTTWRIRNAEKDLILQRINHAVFKQPADIAANTSLLASYLQQTAPGYIFPAPAKTADGKMIFEGSTGFYRLTDFVPGSKTIDTVQKPGQAFEAAKQFGKFTKMLSAFPAGKLKITLPGFHNLNLRYAQFEQALQSGNHVRIRESEPLISEVLANRDIVSIYDSIKGNPSFKTRVTHHDTKISNVLFDDLDKGLCVIDLDTVMPGYFISDAGDMMRTYLSPVNEEEKDFARIAIRSEYFKAIYEGYLSEMREELSPEETSHFIYAGKFMIYMQAMRFLTDHLNNDVYYGSRYEGHNFVRAGNQLVLLKRLTEKENELKTLVD